MFRKLSLVLVTVLVTFSLGVRALGLGEIKLKSGLNQPLKAEIELFSPEGMSEFEVAASLASMTEFEKAGIDYFGYLKNIRFKTVKGPNETLTIEVTTRQPVKEPFLNFLVELNWPKGRMLREYTLLLDPPIFAEKKASTVDQATSTPAPVQTAPAQTQTSPRYQPQPVTQPSAPVFSGESYGPVGEAETLWRIATKVRPSGATIHQTLVALYRANPQAFVNNDINLLKKGAVLTVPGGSEIASIPHRAALQDMVSRTRGTQRDTILDTSGRTTSSRNVTRGEDRLRLAAPEGGEGTGSGSGSSQQVASLRNELVRTKEAAATLEAENEELRRKLQDALAQLEQKSGAVDVESTTAAALANRDQVFADEEPVTDDSERAESILDSLNQTATTEDSSSETTSTSDEMKTDSANTDNELDNTVTDTANEASDTGTSTGSTDLPKTQQSGERPANSMNSLSTSTPPKSSSFFDEPLFMYGALGLVVVLLGAFLVFWKMRQRMSDEEFQDDLVISAQGSSFDTEEGIDMPDVGDDLLGDLDSDDVFEDDGNTEADPLGEADIYIAYGKYEQAEKLLMEAIESQPDRTDLKVKLLECYAETKEKDKFDAVENQFNDIWEEDADAAEQVRNIKAQAWPDEAGVEDEFELPSTEEIFGDDEQSTSDFDDEFSLDDLDTDSDVSLDEDVGTQDIGGEEPSFDTDDLDFDLDADTDETTAPAAEDDFSLDDELLSLETEEPETASSDMDTLELDDFDSESPVDDVQDTNLEGDLDIDLDASDDLDLDLDSEFDLEGDDSLDDDMVDGTDEASTKLDLARAYIDMGDTDGAREILNEVVDEGSEAHKNEALSLLEKI